MTFRLLNVFGNKTLTNTNPVLWKRLTSPIIPNMAMTSIQSRAITGSTSHLSKEENTMDGNEKPNEPSDAERKLTRYSLALNSQHKRSVELVGELGDVFVRSIFLERQLDRLRDNSPEWMDTKLDKAERSLWRYLYLIVALTIYIVWPEKSPQKEEKMVGEEDGNWPDVNLFEFV